MPAGIWMQLGACAPAPVLHDLCTALQEPAPGTLQS